MCIKEDCPSNHTRTTWMWKSTFSPASSPTKKLKDRKDLLSSETGSGESTKLFYIFFSFFSSHKHQASWYPPASELQRGHHTHIYARVSFWNTPGERAYVQKYKSNVFVFAPTKLKVSELACQSCCPWMECSFLHHQPSPFQSSTSNRRAGGASAAQELHIQPAPLPWWSQRSSSSPGSPPDP